MKRKRLSYVSLNPYGNENTTDLFIYSNNYNYVVVSAHVYLHLPRVLMLVWEDFFSDSLNNTCCNNIMNE